MLSGDVSKEKAKRVYISMTGIVSMKKTKQMLNLINTLLLPQQDP